MDNAGSLNLLIRILSDAQGAQQAQDALNKTKEAIAGLGKEGDTALAGIRSMVPELAALSTTAGIIAGIKEAVQAYASYEDKVVGVLAALRVQNDLTDESGKRVQELARKYEALTGKPVADWLDAESTLIRVGRVHLDQMDVQLKLIENISAASGKDLVSTAIAYSRALEGNFTALSRFIPELRQAHTDTEKWAAINDFAAHGQGILEEKTKDTAGTFHVLGNALEEVSVKLGKILYTYTPLKGWSEDLAESISGLAATLPDLTVKLDAAAKAQSDLADVTQADANAQQRLDDLTNRARAEAEIKSAADEQHKTARSIAESEINRQEKRGLITKEGADMQRAQLALDSAQMALERKQAADEYDIALGNLPAGAHPAGNYPAPIGPVRPRPYRPAYFVQVDGSGAATGTSADTSQQRNFPVDLTVDHTAIENAGQGAQRAIDFLGATFCKVVGDLERKHDDLASLVASRRIL